MPKYPSVLKLVQFNCPEILRKDLDRYVEQRSKRDNYTRTDAIVEAVTKYLDDLGALTPSEIQYSIPTVQEA